MIPLVQQRKINFSSTKANTIFFSNLHYNDNERYMYLNKTKIFKFKAHDNMPWYEFLLEEV